MNNLWGVHLFSSNYNILLTYTGAWRRTCAHAGFQELTVLQNNHSLGMGFSHTTTCHCLFPCIVMSFGLCSSSWIHIASSCPRFQIMCWVMRNNESPQLVLWYVSWMFDNHMIHNMTKSQLGRFWVIVQFPFPYLPKKLH